MQLHPSNSNVQPIKSTTTIIGVDELPITSILSNQDIKLKIDHEVDEDEAIILALGYKQEFKRELTLWSTFSVSFSILGLLPSIASTMVYFIVIGISPLPWLIAIIGTSSIALSLAEISSAYPTSGGLYYAVKQLAPPGYIGVLLSWLIGWSNWFVQITGAPSANYSGALMILALKSYTDPSYTPTNGDKYGMSTGLMVSHAIICSLPTRYLAKFNSSFTMINMVFLTIVFIMILGGDNRTSKGLPKFNSNSEAWGFTNQTDWPNGIAFLISFLSVIWTMSGFDAPFHLAEECSNANVATPKAIVLTVATGGIIGWMFMFAIAYTLVDVNAVANDELGLGQPFVSFLTQIMSRKMVLAATSFTIISSFFMGSSCLLAASRVTFSYSRDDVFPFSKYWKKVNPVTQTPVNAVWINWFLGQLLLLLIFAGPAAIGAIFSVGAIGAYIAFSTPVLLKNTYSHKTFKRGPWHLGKFSRPIGALGCSFVLMMIPILCFPNYRGANLTLQNMNWTSVIYFGPMLIVFIYFLVDAHKWFKGPKSNLDPDMIMTANSLNLADFDSNKKTENTVFVGIKNADEKSV